MIHRQVGKDLPHLLLAGSMDLFEIVKILLDCPPIGHRRQDCSTLAAASVQK